MVKRSRMKRATGKRARYLRLAKFLDATSNMEFNINWFKFNRLWKKAGGDDAVADHMWNKFRKHDHSLLNLYGYADLENRRVIAKMVDLWMKEKKGDY